MISSMPRPHFTPGKDSVPILQEAGWAPGPVWTCGNSCPHRDSIPDRPASSQSSYRLSYTAHNQRGRELFYWLLFLSSFICTRDCSLSFISVLKLGVVPVLPKHCYLLYKNTTHQSITQHLYLYTIVCMSGRHVST